MTHWKHSGTLWFGDSTEFICLHQFHCLVLKFLRNIETWIYKKEQSPHWKVVEKLLIILQPYSEVLSVHEMVIHSTASPTAVELPFCTIICGALFLAQSLWYFHTLVILPPALVRWWLSNLRTLLFSFVFELAVTCCDLPCWLRALLPQLYHYTASFPNSFTE